MNNTKKSQFGKRAELRERRNAILKVISENPEITFDSLFTKLFGHMKAGKAKSALEGGVTKTIGKLKEEGKTNYSGCEEKAAEWLDKYYAIPTTQLAADEGRSLMAIRGTAARIHKQYPQLVPPRGKYKTCVIPDEYMVAHYRIDQTPEQIAKIFGVQKTTVLAAARKAANRGCKINILPYHAPHPEGTIMDRLRSDGSTTKVQKVNGKWITIKKLRKLKEMTPEQIEKIRLSKERYRTKEERLEKKFLDSRKKKEARILAAKNREAVKAEQEALKIFKAEERIKERQAAREAKEAAIEKHRAEMAEMRAVAAEKAREKRIAAEQKQRAIRMKEREAAKAKALIEKTKQKATRLRDVQAQERKAKAAREFVPTKVQRTDLISISIPSKRAVYQVAPENLQAVKTRMGLTG